VVGVAENGAVGTAGTVQRVSPNNEIVSVIVGGFIGKLSGSSGAVSS